MQTSRRPQRLALQIQHEISLILFRDVKDRGIGMVTVTGADLSPDLRRARIFVSCMGTDAEKAETMRALSRAAGWIRHELGQRIRMRFLPELEFHTDDSLAYGDRIDRLLSDIKER